jgi:hypothetical protein
MILLIIKSSMEPVATKAATEKGISTERIAEQLQLFANRNKQIQINSSQQNGKGQEQWRTPRWLQMPNKNKEKQ